MSSVFIKFLEVITPPPIVTPEEYEGWQLKWKVLVFRPALLKAEGFLVIGIIFYILCWYFGSSVNARKTKEWLSAHLPIYEQQFSKPQSKSGLIQDGYSDAFNFSTGRRNVTSLHTIFTLRPRHDFFQWIFQTARTFVDLHYRPVDDIQLDFKLAPGALQDGFVWAIVAKDELLSVKANRWDLTLPKTSEHAAVPSAFVVMTEYADVTENLLKPNKNFSLLTVLQDPKILPYIRSLSITDQPRERPNLPIPVEGREKHLILSLHAPSSSHVADTVPLVSAMFYLVDSLNQIHLRPETKNKLKRFREDLDKTIKEEAEKDKKEEALDAKAAAKRKAEEERIAKLSPAEQKKELERERKRSIRKSQSKVARK